MHDSGKRLAATTAWISMFGLTTARSEPPPIVIDASEYALHAPAHLNAGSSRLQLRNLGLLDHHVRLLRLDSGRSFRDFERALVAHSAVPEWAVDVGGFASTESGAESSTAIRLTAGVHVLICTGSLTDGSAMAMRGMYRSLDVRSPSQHTSIKNH